jgi:hypothetical protein
VNLRDGGRGDTNTLTDGLIRAAIGLGNVLHPWLNSLREDIDNDGTVAPLDALQLINQLNNFGSRSLGAVPASNQSLPNFLDPSGNDSLEPIDALIVINFLNNATLNSEAEGAENLRFARTPLLAPAVDRETFWLRSFRESAMESDAESDTVSRRRRMDDRASNTSHRHSVPAGDHLRPYSQLIRGSQTNWQRFTRQVDEILARDDSLIN